MLNEKECTFTPKINDNKKFNDLDKKYPLYDPNYHEKKESKINNFYKDDSFKPHTNEI